MRYNCVIFVGTCLKTYCVLLNDMVRHEASVFFDGLEVRKVCVCNITAPAGKIDGCVRELVHLSATESCLPDAYRS